MGQSFDWHCPYCNRHAAITPERLWAAELVIPIEHSEGRHAVGLHAVVCPNRTCRRYTLDVERGPFIRDTDGNVHITVLQKWQLLPPSSAKVIPSYVPKPIVDDYNEACAITTLSPKASATLSRRCLQGMIRDYWGIRKGRLVDEITALEVKVDPLTWRAVDGVRTMGNVGAHMAMEINTIVDVDPGEAEALLRLIEILIDDWYVTRHDREERLKAVVTAADSKKAKLTPP